jgi:exodeoxyribonuclease III
MKIISWNVNGIRAVHKKGFLDFIKEQDPDILCLQETKAHKDQLDPILHHPTAEYSSFWSSAKKKGYSGTVTYTKEEPEKVEHGIGLENFDSEGRFVITHFKDFVLYNVYFPNGASGVVRHSFKQEFLKLFTEHLSKQLKTKEVILVGDYNVAHKPEDVYDPVRLAKTSGFLPEEREWFDGFLDVGFVDTFRYKHPDVKDKYSWWSYFELARPANRGWRIDYVCVSKGLKDRVIEAGIMDDQQGSDHCPVWIELK